jgi:hypothetical protein
MSSASATPPSTITPTNNAAQSMTTRRSMSGTPFTSSGAAKTRYVYAPVSSRQNSTPSGRDDASHYAALDPSLGYSAWRSATRKDRILIQDVVDPDNHEPRYMERHGVDLHQRRGLHQFRRIAPKAVLTPSSPLSIVHPQRIEDRRVDLHHSGVTSSIRNPAPSSSPKGC